MNPIYLITSLLLLAYSQNFAQQQTDTAIEIAVKHPKYQKGKGPQVIIDGGHFNFHTYEGRYRPFANLLEKDGYLVTGTTRKFTPDLLKEGDILVIANPIHESNVRRWVLPNPSAFTKKEIKHVKKWVEEGGSLLLIADHMPFPGATYDLAAAFGVEFSNGFAMPVKRVEGPTSSFSIAAGTLHINAITQGEQARDQIDKIHSFTGSAFKIPEGAQPIMTFKNDHFSLEPDTAWVFHPDTRNFSLEGWHQGAFMEFGKGRLVVYGEAAMLTAQTQQNGKVKMGFNHPVATQNTQLILNTIHWLDTSDLESNR